MFNYDKEKFENYTRDLLNELFYSFTIGADADATDDDSISIEFGVELISSEAIEIDANTNTGETFMNFATFLVVVSSCMESLRRRLCLTYVFAHQTDCDSLVFANN